MLQRLEFCARLLLDVRVQAVAASVHRNDGGEIVYAQVPHRLGDAELEQMHANYFLHRARIELRRAADRSFNQITVDGDSSTNDTLIALANGESRTPAITDEGAEADQLEAMLTAVCQYLAKCVARDGEGATCLIEVTVTGAVTAAAAGQVAKTIAGSSLVKAAIFGHDPNWGRIAAAAGRARGLATGAAAAPAAGSDGLGCRFLEAGSPGRVDWDSCA